MLAPLLLPDAAGTRWATDLLRLFTKSGAENKKTSEGTFKLQCLVRERSQKRTITPV